MQGVGKAHIDAYDQTEAQRPIPYSPNHHTHTSFCTVAREKMDTVASKMENVAKNSIRVLSDSVKAPKDSALSRESPSILCLTLHNANKSKTSWNEFGSTDPPNSHALSIQLSGGDRQICLRNQGGSTVFSLPAGSMLVTIGKQVQVSCYRYIHYSSLSILKTAKMIKSTHKRCLNLHLYSVKYGQWFFSATRFGPCTGCSKSETLVCSEHRNGPMGSSRPLLASYCLR
jgi:hypothetical protein